MVKEAEGPGVVRSSVEKPRLDKLLSRKESSGLNVSSTLMFT
jgi:hypothetical protein